jgi:hypothetical protein
MTVRLPSARATACPANLAACRTAMARPCGLAYSDSIETPVDETAMKPTLGLRTLLVLALVTAATLVLVHPALGGGQLALDALLVLARN